MIQKKVTSSKGIGMKKLFTVLLLVSFAYAQSHTVPLTQEETILRDKIISSWGYRDPEKFNFELILRYGCGMSQTIDSDNYDPETYPYCQHTLNFFKTYAPQIQSADLTTLTPEDHEKIEQFAEHICKDYYLRHEKPSQQ